MRIDCRRLTATALIVLAGTTPAFAFKLETHIWIAQQVINDLVTCRIDGHPQQRCVTITLTDPATHATTKKKLAVEPGLAESIIRHQQQFRMGAVGPDGFPDLVAGQLTAHPGVADGWQADDWMRHLVSHAGQAFFKPPSGFHAGEWITFESQAFAAGYVVHGASDVFAHSYVNTYAGDIFLLFDGEREVEARHILLEGFIRDFNPPFLNSDGEPIGPPDTLVTAPRSFLRTHLLRTATPVDQYRRQTSTRYLAAMYDFWDKHNQLVDLVDASVAAINAKISSMQSSIDSLKNLQVCTPRICAFGVCTPRVCANVYPAYCAVDPGTCLAVESTQLALNSLKSAVSRVGSDIRDPVAASRDQIGDAIDDYVVASEQVVKELMKPDGRPREPLLHWIECSAPAFAGVHDVASTVACAPPRLLRSAYNKMKEVCDALDDIGAITWAFVPMCPASAYIDAQVRDGLATEIAQALTADGSTIELLVRLDTQSSTPEAVTAQFSSHATTKELLDIPDIVQRVTSDMHVVDGHFDPDAFQPVFNAIQLSKLSLVGAAELNRLVEDSGIDGTIYGPQLYWPIVPFNVMFWGVRSLDGNQQWQEESIPYPRAGTHIPRRNLEANYPFGYRFDGSRGFRLWQDCEVRTNVFLQLFKGPLAKGIESPLPELSEILSASDPNRSSEADPFPLAPGSILPTKTESSSTGSVYVCGATPATVLPNRGFRVPFLLADTTPPAIAAPPDLAPECTANKATDVDLGVPSVTDNRDPNPVVASNAPPEFPYGLTNVTWRAVDSAGNSAEAVQQVNVRDTLAPMFAVTLATRRATATSPEGTIVPLTAPVALDACDGPITATRRAPDAPLAVGTHTIEWTATDRAGHISSVTQEVIVEALTGDIDVDGDVDLLDVQSVVAARGTTSANGASDLDGDGAIDASERALFELLKAGRDLRDLDHNGRIDLVDAQLTAGACVPSACPPVLVCPADMRVENDPHAAGAGVTFNATVVAAFPIPAATTAPGSGSFFPLGRTTVHASATNLAGTGSCSFVVTVVDVEAPRVTAPPDILVEATSPGGATVLEAQLGVAQATDNAPGVSVSRTNAPDGHLFPLGTTVLTHTARDAAGNSTTVTQQVVVRDTTPPAITILTPTVAVYAVNQTVPADYSCADIASGVSRCTGSATAGQFIDTATVGAKTFTVAASDVAGNASSRSVTYSVSFRESLLYDPTKSAKSGSTLPVKIRIVDASGTNMSSAALLLHAVGLRKLSNDTSMEVADAGNANPDNDFRYDASLQGYVFNLKTTGLSGGTYGLEYTVSGDPTVHRVLFSVK